MKKKFLLIIAVYLILIFNSSCFFISPEVTTQEIKFRERNETDELKIISPAGNITIHGWFKDIIDINTTKRLNSGFEVDLDLMQTITEKRENSLTIINRIPARVDGSIDMEIFVPFYLFKIYIDSMNGDISIEDYLGDIELTHNNGKIKFVFMGNLLRVNTYKSDSDITVRSYNACDMIINKEDGDLNMTIEAVSSPSFLDIKTLNGDVSLFISPDCDHRLFLKNLERDIKINYDLSILFAAAQSKTIKLGRRGDDIENLSIDISTKNGKTILNLLP